MENLGGVPGRTYPPSDQAAVAARCRSSTCCRHTSGLTYGFQQRSNVDAAYRENKIGESSRPATQSQIDDLVQQISSARRILLSWNYSARSRSSSACVAGLDDFADLFSR